MTISIVTPVLNAANSIGKTIQSIQDQSLQPSQYIVVDGGSSDSTLTIVREFSKDATILSGADTGVYHAMNKGILAATGDIVGILNADDYLYNSEVLAQVNKVFTENTGSLIVYGDIIYIDAGSGKEVRQWKPGPFARSKLSNGWAMPHPAVFVRRSLYEKAGLYNTIFRIAGDYEIMLRWFLVYGIQPTYIPEILVVMAPGGVSGKNFRARRRGWRELLLAWHVNNLQPPFAFILRRVFFKLRQLLV